ncbi:MAG: hypothetical protein IJ716_07960 [Lachnospiraceae bacterium]|nr:hypothetical protein [Lachnospiraceae bacterium]
MTAWMQPAWQGWRNFITEGKLPAVLIAVLLYLLFSERGRAMFGGRRKLIYYGAVAAGACLFPGTAAILMKYQTAFYDYPFIWSIVPVTALIAFGGVVILQEHWRRDAGIKGFLFNLVLTVSCILVLSICGGLGIEWAVSDTDGNGYAPVSEEARTQAEDVLREVRENMMFRTNAEICLWAPREIMEYARLQGETAGMAGAIPKLLYGRNMWDEALNAYTYDGYPEELHQLYEWMEETADGNGKKLQSNVEKAFSMGANCVLLPKGIVGFNPESVDWAQVVELEQYYLLMKV